MEVNTSDCRCRSYSYYNERCNRVIISCWLRNQKTFVSSEFPRVHIFSNAISQIVFTQVFHLSEREALSVIIEFPRDAMETCRRYTKEVRGRYGTSKRAGEQFKSDSAQLTKVI